MEKIADDFPEGLRPLGVMVVDNYSEYRANAVRWRFVHIGVLILAALFSASAGVVIKLQSTLRDEGRRSDVAAFLGAAGALLITVSALGGFEQHWRANRVAASEMENLAYQILANPNQEQVIREIQNINRRRLAGIVQLRSENVTDKPVAP